MEKWHLVDENMKPNGVVFERRFDIPIPKGSYYRVVEIWTLLPDGRILLTQRHPDKYLGLMWESTGGAVVENEDIKLSAQRELFEETGLECPLDALIYLTTTKYDTCFVSSYYHVYNGNLESLVMQDGETVAYKFVDFDAISSLQSDIPENIYNRLMNFIPEFKKVLKLQ